MEKMTNKKTTKEELYNSDKVVEGREFIYSNYVWVVEFKGLELPNQDIWGWKYPKGIKRKKIIEKRCEINTEYTGKDLNEKKEKIRLTIKTNKLIYFFPFAYNRVFNNKENAIKQFKWFKKKFLDDLKDEMKRRKKDYEKLKEIKKEMKNKEV